MHILFVSNNYTPYSGGLVSSINTTIGELHADGHRVTLITLNFLGTEHNDPPWVRRVPSLVRFRFKQNYMAIPWRPKFYLRQWIEELKPDVIHLHHPFLLGPIAARIAEQMGIKTVFTYHTIYEAYAYYLPLPSSIATWIIKKRVLYFCHKVDHIIAPSTGVKNYLQKYSIGNAAVLPSGLSPLFLSQPFIPKTIKKPYQLLYVGRFVKEKNIPFLFDVMAQLPDEYQITLVGYGEYTTYLKQYAYEFHRLSENRVRFIIKPDKKVLREIYQKSHLFLFASRTDTQGLVLAEAMACATPVIALDGFGQRDIIRHGMNGFIVANADQMISTIKAVMRNGDSYHMLQKEAYKTAQNYRSDILLTSLLTIYERHGK